MVRGRDLARLIREGDDAVLDYYTKASLMERMSQVARFVGPRGQSYGFIRPPTVVAEMLMDRAPQHYQGLPVVDFVTRAPIYGPGWHLIVAPGYHPEGRILHVPDPTLETILPVNPRAVIGEEDDARFAWQAARDFLLTELLGDFPFASPADKANALGAMLLTVVRPAIQGATPMHAYIAPEVGSGKGPLADVTCYPVLGTLVGDTPELENEAEWRKLITTKLIMGVPVIRFDNLRSRLDSGPLGMALTQRVWEDRILGVNRLARVEIRNMWMCTANNLSTSREIARRVVPIYLDPGVERRGSARDPSPASRGGILICAPAAANRSALLWALLTLVEHWRTEGEDLYGEPGTRREGAEKLGSSFGEYARVIGGILEAAAVRGFLENHHRLSEDVAEDVEAASFFAKWAETFSEPVTAEDLMATAANPLADLGAALPGAIIEKRPEARLRALRYWLRSHRGQIRADCSSSRSVRTARRAGSSGVSSGEADVSYFETTPGECTIGRGWCMEMVH